MPTRPGPGTTRLRGYAAATAAHARPSHRVRPVDLGTSFGWLRIGSRPDPGGRRASHLGFVATPEMLRVRCEFPVYGVHAL